MELKSRDREILEILIADYIATAAPVGSRAIAKIHPRHLSAATIRSVLGDLEEMGFLNQPHTSAGRVPTTIGLRYYVDTILQQRDLGEKEMIAIQKRYGDKESGVDDVVKRTAKILSTISNYTGLIVAPSSKNTPLRHIEFIKLSSHKLLGILVTTLGDVQNKIVELNEDVSLLQLEKINNFCNRAFVNLTLEQVKGKIAKELQQEEIKYDKLLSQALVCASSVLKNEGSAELYVEGESSLLREPEFADLKKAKQVLEALEEKKGLLHIFEQTMQGEGVKIFIGNEIGISGVEECSVITATYKEKGEPIGTLGVIGPKRMDYSKVISVVDFTAKLLSDILGGKI